MLATADCTNHYSEQIIYESEWTEHIPTGVSWLNLLTAQPIPEETDGIDSPGTPERKHSGNSYSSSTSVESCYVVLEIQRPVSVDKTSSNISDKEEEFNSDDEEEEEMEEVIEELNFAQLKHDDHSIVDEQFTVSMTTEIPTEECVLEYQQEHYVQVEEYAKVTEPVIHEMTNDILFHKAKALSRLSKRMKAMSSVSSKDQNFSTSSDDESLKVTKLKTIQKINEYHPTAISSVAAEQQISIQPSNSLVLSTPSLDSIENPKSPIRTRITTTFSSLSTQRPSNPIQTPRINPTMGTTTLTRTFAFDRACMEKYGRAKQKISEPMEVPITPISESSNQQDAELPSKTTKKTESLAPFNDQLNCRSFTNTLPTPFYIGSGESTMDESEVENHSSIPRSTSVSTSLSKGSLSLLTSMKKYVRTVASDYCSTLNSYNGNTSTEPKLIQLKSLDGRFSLRDNNIRESYDKPRTISGSISHKLNQLGLSKMSSIQDLSSQTTTTFNNSYRKRMLNRFRTLIEDHSTEQSLSRPWQHKTISELFNEKLNKLNR